MRKLFVIIAVIFTAIGIIFTALPFDTLALLPIGIGFVFAFLAFSKSDTPQKKLPKILLVVSLVCVAVVLGKTYLVKDEVATDVKFEKEKIESKKEDKKELEDLEKDLE